MTNLATENCKSFINTFKCRVACTRGEISVRIKIAIAFNFRFPIQLVVFVPVGLSSFLRYLLQVFLGVQVPSVTRLGQLTVGKKDERPTGKNPTIGNSET